MWSLDSHIPRKLKDLGPLLPCLQCSSSRYIKTAGIKSLQAFGYHFG